LNDAPCQLLGNKAERKIEDERLGRALTKEKMLKQGCKRSDGMDEGKE
jgi:hypothetical protein